jgi:hypothetical protein
MHKREARPRDRQLSMAGVRRERERKKGGLASVRLGVGVECVDVGVGMGRAGEVCTRPLGTRMSEFEES